MAKVVGRNATLGIHDSSSVCQVFRCQMNSITLSETVENIETTSFCDDNRTYLNDGIRDWELTWEAYFDNTLADSMDEALFGIMGASTHFCFGPTGSAAGAVKYTACGILTNYEMTFSAPEAARCTGTMVARSGSLTRSTF